jgi:hypothetical protein
MNFAKGLKTLKLSIIESMFFQINKNCFPEILYFQFFPHVQFLTFTLIEFTSKLIDLIFKDLSLKNKKKHGKDRDAYSAQNTTEDNPTNNLDFPMFSDFGC